MRRPLLSFGINPKQGRKGGQGGEKGGANGGHGEDEENTIEGFGSLRLKNALRASHGAGTKIRKKQKAIVCPCT